MHKTIILAFCLNPIIAFSSLNNQQQVNFKNHTSTWEPDWVRKNIVIEDKHSFEGDQKNHAEWTMQVKKSDFTFKEIPKSFQITNLNFTFAVEYVPFLRGARYRHPSFKLNNDQLVKATNIISQDKQLSFWVKGLNTFLDFHIRSGISQIKSAYIDENFGSGKTKYKIYHFSAKIDYKYLINSDEENIAEKNIRNFFKYEHDFDLTNFHNGNDVLENLKAELKKIIPESLQDELRVDLPYRDYTKNNSNRTEEWTVSVSLYNGAIDPQNNKKYFKLKLKNIQLYSEEVVNIYEYLRSINWIIRRPQKYASYSKIQRMENTLPIFIETLKENYIWKNQTKPASYFAKISENHLIITNAVHQKKDIFYINIFVKTDYYPLGMLAIKDFN